MSEKGEATMSKPEPEVKQSLYIHLVRHAKGEHNYSSRTTPQAVKEFRKQILNPALTARGKAEALDLRHRFPYMNDITQIIVSPLRRTIQNAAIAFEPAILAGVKPIIIEDLRETGTGPTSTGTPLADVLAEMGDIGKSFDDSYVFEFLMVNPEARFESEKRADKVRQMLNNLACVLGSQDPELGLTPQKVPLWKGFEVTPLRDGRDIHIVVVTHAELLMKIVGEVKRDPNGRGYFWNAEFRTYEFRGAENCEKDAQKPWDLLEIEESLEAVHPLTEEKHLAERAKARELQLAEVENVATAKRNDAMLQEDLADRAMGREIEPTGAGDAAVAKGDDVVLKQGVVLPDGLDISVLDPRLFVPNPQI